MALFDAEGGSNISGTEAFTMITGLILTAAFCALMLPAHAFAKRVSSTLAPVP
jgi:hypothetical protein